MRVLEPKQAKVVRTFSLDPDVFQELEDLRRATRIPRSRLVVFLLRDALARGAGQALRGALKGEEGDRGA